MNEKLQEAIASNINKVMEWVESGANLATEQVPDILIQVVTYGRAMSTLGMVAGVMALCVSIFIVVLGARSDVEDYFGLFCAVALIPLLISLAIFAKNISGFCMTWFAPKLYIIEYLKYFIK